MLGTDLPYSVMPGSRFIELPRIQPRGAADIALGAPRVTSTYKMVVRDAEAALTVKADHLREPLWDMIVNSGEQLDGERTYAEKRPAVRRSRLNDIALTGMVAIQAEPVGAVMCRIEATAERRSHDHEIDPICVNP